MERAVQELTGDGTERGAGIDEACSMAFEWPPRVLCRESAGEASNGSPRRSRGEQIIMN